MSGREEAKVLREFLSKIMPIRRLGYMKKKLVIKSE